MKFRCNISSLCDEVHCIRRLIPCTSPHKPSARFPLTAALPCVVDNLLHTMIIRRLNMRARRPRFHIPSPVILRRLCSLTNSTWFLPNSLWAVPFLLLTSKVNFLMPLMRTTMWSSSGNHFASRCLSPFIAHIIYSTKFTTTRSTNTPRYPHHYVKRMLQSPEPVDLKLWTRSGGIQCWHRCISLRYDFYKGTRRMKLLGSNEIRQLRDVCVFEINGIEVFMWNINS